MKAPHFSLPNQDGKIVSLESFKGKKLVLYFYPKADTPGCTAEACGLRDNIAALKARGMIVVGVSPDEPADLKTFAEKYSLPFTLLADPSTKTLQAYNVWGEKTFMGHNYFGVLRTTFLIDEQGHIVKRYDDVKPETHADMILADVPMPEKIIRKIPMKEPSRKSPTKSVDKKIIAKAARKITKEEQKVAAAKLLPKKLVVKKIAKK